MASAVLLDGYLLKKKRDDKKSLLVCDAAGYVVCCCCCYLHYQRGKQQRTGDETAQVARKVSCDTGLAMMRRRV